MVVVAALAFPAGAAASLYDGMYTLGGGSASGSFDYSGGVPSSSCAPTSFQVSATSASFSQFITVLDGYVGPLTISGSGASSCETALNGSGTLQLSVSGRGPTDSTLQCAQLTGSYSRSDGALSATVSGTCVDNNFPTKETFTLGGAIEPAGLASDSSPVTETFQGALEAYDHEGGDLPLNSSYVP
jgi:hypothetical protein